MNKYTKILSVVGALTVSSAFGQTFVNSNITTDTTWSGVVILETTIAVKDDATLTILPGTIVRGQPRTDLPANAPSGNPGALVVTQKGQINAVGSSTSPIIFTTAAVDNDNDGVADDLNGDGFLDAYPGFENDGVTVKANPVFFDDTPATAPLAPLDADGEANVQLWGGVVICGEAPTNLGAGGPAYGQGEVEGLVTPAFPIADATYGGLKTSDNSGTLQFVSIRHGGDEIGTGNEINGLTLAGVGNGTVISDVEIYMNFDDGFEWFGGTVDTTNLVVVFAGDDQFDLDQGFTGKGQFWFAVTPFFNDGNGVAWGGGGSGDAAGEWDGEDSGESSNSLNTRIDSLPGSTGADATPFPLSYPTVYNMTVLGGSANTGGNDFAPTNSANRGIRMRNGFAGELFNSIIVNVGNAALEAQGSGFGAFDSASNATNGLITIASTTVENSGAPDAGATTALANGDTLLGVDFVNNINVGEANFINPGVNFGITFALQNQDQTFNPAGVAGKLDSSLKATPLNPRPTPADFLAGTTAPVQSGFVSTGERGAFPNVAGDNFTAGWTVLSISGLMADN